jgi:hypothetical protein
MHHLSMPQLSVRIPGLTILSPARNDSVTIGGGAGAAGAGG